MPTTRTAAYRSRFSSSGRYTVWGLLHGVRYVEPLLFSLGLLIVLGCSQPQWHFGVGGRYNKAKDEVTKRRGEDLDKAVSNLEGIAAENPTYRDSLTLLGRAYYKKARYRDAYLILQRALAVNKEDEIAWLILGLAQMRLGENHKGLESIKGGLTLLGKAMKDGYKGFDQWDRAGQVSSSLRRTIFLAQKGLDERDDLIRATENLIVRIDDEEWRQKGDKSVERAMEG